MSRPLVSLLFQFYYFFLCECFGCLCERAVPARVFDVLELFLLLSTFDAVEATFLLVVLQAIFITTFLGLKSFPHLISF